MLLVCPLRKHLTFTFGSIDSSDLRDVRHAEHLQLANLSGTRILVRKPSANELKVFSARRILKNRNALCDAAMHKVSGFERPAPSESIDITMTSTGATGSSIPRPAKQAPEWGE
jgi:hypothetical protein